MVATGFDHYAPRPGEYGYGLPGVVTLPEFHDGADLDGESLTFGGRPIGSVAFIYCVGSRQVERATLDSVAFGRVGRKVAGTLTQVFLYDGARLVAE